MRILGLTAVAVTKKRPVDARTGVFCLSFCPVSSCSFHGHVRSSRVVFVALESREFVQECLRG